MKDEKNYEVVGDIRIKEPKKRKKNKKPLNLDKKFFAWFMFFAMLAAFIAPLVYYLITIIVNSNS